MTQLSPRVETFGAGDQSWLGSKFGTDEARTFTINVGASSAKITNGQIKSGEAFAIVAGLGVPYNSGGSGGTEILAGFRYAGNDKDIFVSLYPGDGTYLEAYWQGLFKQASPAAFSRHRYGLAQTKITLLET